MHLIPLEQAFGLMFGLTPRQEEVLLAIIRFRAAHGYSPTIRNLRPLLGITSTNGVDCHLRGLERKGALTRPRHGARSMVPRVKFISTQELFADAQA